MSDLAGALDEVERVQRQAIEEAGECVREALDKIRPFELNEGRVLPGVTRAVAEERTRLMQSLANLGGIIAAHFTKDPAQTTLPNPIAAVLDQAHADAVIAAKAEAA